MTENRPYAFRLLDTDVRERAILEAWITEKMEQGNMKRSPAIYEIVVSFIRQHANLPKAGGTYSEADIRLIAASVFDERASAFREWVEQLVSSPERMSQVNKLHRDYQNAGGQMVTQETIDALMADFDREE